MEGFFKSGRGLRFIKAHAGGSLRLGVIEKIIPEASNGIANNLQFTTEIMKKELIKKLNELNKLDMDNTS